MWFRLMKYKFSTDPAGLRDGFRASPSFGILHAFRQNASLGLKHISHPWFCLLRSYLAFGTQFQCYFSWDINYAFSSAHSISLLAPLYESHTLIWHIALCAHIFLFYFWGQGLCLECFVFTTILLFSRFHKS